MTFQKQSVKIFIFLSTNHYFTNIDVGWRVCRKSRTRPPVSKVWFVMLTLFQRNWKRNISLEQVVFAEVLILILLGGSQMQGGYMWHDGRWRLSWSLVVQTWPVPRNGVDYLIYTTEKGEKMMCSAKRKRKNDELGKRKKYYFGKKKRKTMGSANKKKWWDWQRKKFITCSWKCKRYC